MSDLARQVLDRLGIKADRLPIHLWTERTHTEIILGNAREGHVVKIICDSTGGIVQLPWDLGRAREKTPYPRCQFCGLPSGRWKDIVIDVTPELAFDTDQMDAWPALPALVDEALAS